MPNWDGDGFSFWEIGIFVFIIAALMAIIVSKMPAPEIPDAAIDLTTIVIIAIVNLIGIIAGIPIGKKIRERLEKE